MGMISLTESIIEYLFLTSALLLIMGIFSFFALSVLRIQGKPRLWICTLLIIIPFVYPIRILFPDSIKISVPLKTYQSFHFKTLDKISSKKIDSKDLSPASERTAAYDTNLIDNKTFTLHGTLPDDLQGTDIKGFFISNVNWKLIAFLLWGTSFIYFIVRLLITIRNSALILKLAETVRNPQILKLLNLCARDTGLSRTPRLLALDKIPSPMAMGFFRPDILIPEHLLKPEYREGLQFTLLHEMKHVHQKHNLLLLIESIIGAAYFFHPVIYWAKKKIHEELELICDSHVTEVTDKSIPYADFLLHEIWQQNHGRNPALALPFISGFTKTTNRIHSILENCRETRFAQIRGKAVSCLIILSFLSILLLSTAPPPQGSEKLLQGANSTVIKDHDKILLQSISLKPEKGTSKEFKPGEPLSREKTLAIPEPEKSTHNKKSSSPVNVASVTESGIYEGEEKTTLQEKPLDEYLLENNQSSIITADELISTKIPKAGAEAMAAQTMDEITFSTAERDMVDPARNASTEQSESHSVKISNRNTDKYLGKPVNELSLYHMDNIEIINSETILFIMRGGDLYLTRLSDPCYGLLYTNEFQFDSFTNKVTKFDRIHAVSHGQIMDTTVMLGEFYPYHYEGSIYKAIKLLKNGLLEELLAEGSFRNNHQKG